LRLENMTPRSRPVQASGRNLDPARPTDTDFHRAAMVPDASRPCGVMRRGLEWKTCVQLGIGPGLKRRRADKTGEQVA
jgi:hypothetical protein